MAKRYLLDTSAMLAFLGDEPGATQIDDLLQGSRAGRVRVYACSITLMELFSTAIRGKGEDEAIGLIALVKAWPLEWIFPDEPTLLQAGRLKASFRLSVADALIAAAANLHQATLAHKDPELEALRGTVQLLSLPFKRGTRQPKHRV